MQRDRQVNDGRGADIIALQEVENRAILERLRVEYLADLNYLPAVLIEGTDVRGIDVAFLSRLPLAQPPRLHPLELPAEYADREGDTRGVLEATFELPDGSLLTGFSVHFPAPFHPTAMRVAAYNHLNKLQQSVPPGNNAFAAGDFNTTSTEDTQQSLFERFARPTWTIAHELCDDCSGTYYYARGDIWSFLELDRESVRLAASTAEQLREDGSPKRYNAAARSGVSDHLPLLIKIKATP
jgi:endonuclease/exonuclease/phosphatase family metal-dependent hydrolase